MSEGNLDTAEGLAQKEIGGLVTREDIQAYIGRCLEQQVDEAGADFTTGLGVKILKLVEAANVRPEVQTLWEQVLNDTDVFTHEERAAMELLVSKDSRRRQAVLSAQSGN